MSASHIIAILGSILTLAFAAEDIALKWQAVEFYRINHTCPQGEKAGGK